VLVEQLFGAGPGLGAKFFWTTDMRECNYSRWRIIVCGGEALIVVAEWSSWGILASSISLVVTVMWVGHVLLAIVDASGSMVD